jgi:plasmid stabilization system protein ParE
MIVEFDAAAADDARAAHDAYDSIRPGPGAEFANALEATVERLRQFPGTGEPLRGPIRRSTLGRFP